MGNHASWRSALSSLLAKPGLLQGSARVIRCLQDSREELSYECRATLFDAEVRMAEDIDFKYPMKRACTSELSTFCKGIPHGDARLIRSAAAPNSQTLSGLLTAVRSLVTDAGCVFECH